MNRDNFLNTIIKYMESYDMLAPGDGVIAGVSGGADSVTLFCLLIELRKHFADILGCDIDEALKIKVVHINHMIRGEEADRDQHFVEELCARNDIECVVYRKDIPAFAKEMHMTEEEAGRTFRYECFAKELEALEMLMAKDQKNKVSSKENEVSSIENRVRIAVAHNKDDVAETVLYNMIRGSSLLGLAGIKPVRDKIIRPLLMTSRSDIEEYLKNINQAFITDSTNQTTDYARNRIRHLVIPELKKINSRAVDHIADIAMDSLNLGEDITSLIEENTKDEIDIETLRNNIRIVQGEMVLSKLSSVCGRRKDLTREHINSVIALCDMETGKRVDLPYGMSAERVYEKIVITILENESKDISPKLNDPVSDATEGERLVTRIIPYSPELDITKKEYTKLIDYDKINFVPVLRFPEPDDFITVNSAGGTKKLSRYFTNEKVRKCDRNSIPVVADGSEIIWIVGMRLSERYKISSDTKTVMEIKYIGEKSNG